MMWKTAAAKVPPAVRQFYFFGFPLMPEGGAKKLNSHQTPALGATEALYAFHGKSPFFFYLNILAEKVKDFLVDPTGIEPATS
ncbi:MAG: hypothetical protein ACOCU8_00040 [Patescibacteria group bacterium]